MIDAVDHDKSSIFIKAVSGTLFDMINAVFRDKPLILISATFREKLVPHHQAVNINFLYIYKFIKAISGTVFDCRLS